MFRILHANYDPDMQRIVDAALSLDPTLTVRSCVADEVPAMAVDWSPDLILLSAILPGTDGPALLARLRANPRTINIAVVFLAGDADPHDLAQFKSLGAAAIVTRPFDPVAFVGLVRGHLKAAKLSQLGGDYAERMRADAATISLLRDRLRSDPGSSVVLDDLQTCVHKLAGSAGVLHFYAVSRAAGDLQGSLIALRAGRATPQQLEADFDRLFGAIESTLEQSKRPALLELGMGSSHAPRPAPPAQDAVRPRNRVPSVLIADDDPAILGFLASRCTQLGFEVQTAANGLQALILARRSKPDVMIVDVYMPGADGFSLCSRLLETGSEPCDVIVITGRPDADLSERAKGFGTYYVYKGPDFWNEIRAALAKIFPDMAAKILEAPAALIEAEVRKRPVVLVVDDDPAVELFLSSRLRKRGIDMLYASDGTQGYLMACREKPSVIISDYFMPDGDAFYLLTRLRSTPATGTIPVVVMTGRPLDKWTEDSLRREVCGRPGASKVIQKSFETGELFAALEKFCALEHGATGTTAH
jgi:CheY-like chemotaxis protein